MLQQNSRLKLRPSSVPMDVTGEEVDVEEIIKATVVRDALLTQMVIVGHMVSRSHNTTSENHAPPKNPSTNI